MKKIKKSVFILFSVIFFLFAITAYMYASALNDYNTKAQEFTGTGEISLTDSYDSESSQVSEFFNSEDSNQILRDTYQQLVQNKKIEYYEVLPQPVEYVGSFEYPLSVVDGDRSVVEQKIDGEKITPIKTLMLNQTFYDRIRLEKKLRKGTGFQKSEYNQHSHIFGEMKAFITKTGTFKANLLRYGQIILLTSLCMVILYLLGKYLNQFFFAKHKEILQMGAERIKIIYIILAITFSGLLCKQRWTQSKEK